MTVPIMQDNRPSPRKVDAAQLWPGGIATAVVAGLVALVGVLVCRWLFGIPILAPRRDGAYGDAHTTGLVVTAAVAALVATALAHLLLVSTPRPLRFLAWIIGLVTVVAVLYPFSTTAPLSEKVATAAVSLVIGIAIGSLISGVAARSIRPRPVAGDYPTRRDYAAGRDYPQDRDYPAGRDYPQGREYPTEREYEPMDRDRRY